MSGEQGDRVAENSENKYTSARGEMRDGAFSDVRFYRLTCFSAARHSFRALRSPDDRTGWKHDAGAFPSLVHHQMIIERQAETESGAIPRARLFCRTTWRISTASVAPSRWGGR